MSGISINKLVYLMQLLYFPKLKKYTPFSQTVILPMVGNGSYGQAFSGKTGESDSVARALRSSILELTLA
jgi:hypothetical protein